MSKLFLIDAGHGGINPDTGKYVTSGKRSPVREDGTQFYEGVNNRINARLIVWALKEAGLKAELLHDTWQDIPLSERVQEVNTLAKQHDVILLSIHSDAYGNGKEWTSPKGFSVWTSKGKTKSDDLAKIYHGHLKKNFEAITDDRGIREANFYILRATHCPAILLELGFHTNKQELTLMETPTWRNKIVKSIVEGCLDVEGIEYKSLKSSSYIGKNQ